MGHDLRIGVLALQGAFREHVEALRGLGADVVEVLGDLEGEPVLVRDGRFLLASFHPELTDDRRVHEQFLAMVEEASSVGSL